MQAELFRTFEMLALEPQPLQTPGFPHHNDVSSVTDSATFEATRIGEGVPFGLVYAARVEESQVIYLGEANYDPVSQTTSYPPSAGAATLTATIEETYRDREPDTDKD